MSGTIGILKTDPDLLHSIGSVTVTRGAIYVDGCDAEGASCREVALMAAAWASVELKQAYMANLAQPGAGNLVIGEAPIPALGDLQIRVDHDRDVFTIGGVEYAAEYFRRFAFTPIGTVLRVVQRDRTVGVQALWTSEVARLQASLDGADLLDALDLDVAQFRTEGGYLNRGKLRAAILNPHEYLADDHWLNECKPSLALKDVAAERLRQVFAEGWSTAHDDEHGAGQLCAAGAAYALHASDSLYQPLQDDLHHGSMPLCWPWSLDWWKPSDSRRDLVKAAALILAEIERLDRAERAAVQAPARGTT